MSAATSQNGMGMNTMGSNTIGMNRMAQGNSQTTSVPSASSASATPNCSSRCQGMGAAYVCASMGTRIVSLLNSCFASCQNMVVVHTGKCTQEEVDNAGSGSSSGSSDSGSSKCSKCSKRYKPVCGSDNMTYDNLCLAKCNDITDTTPGECSEDGALADDDDLATTDDAATTGTDDTAPIENPAIKGNSTRLTLSLSLILLLFLQ